MTWMLEKFHHCWRIMKNPQWYKYVMDDELYEEDVTYKTEATSKGD